MGEAHRKIKGECVSTLFLFSWFTKKDSSKESFFKGPEEVELAKDKSVKQQKEIVDRKDQHPIQDIKPGRLIFMKQPSCDDRLDKHYRKTGAGKDNQNDNHLPRRFDMPAVLKFDDPMWCGHCEW